MNQMETELDMLDISNTDVSSIYTAPFSAYNVL